MRRKCILISKMYGFIADGSNDGRGKRRDEHCRMDQSSLEETPGGFVWLDCRDVELTFRVIN